MIATVLVHPDLTVRETEASNIIRQIGLSRSHPDLYWADAEEKLGIEQIRKIQQFLSLKPYQSNRQAVVITSAESMSLDAQNAFLKTLEEPPNESLIILGLSNEEQVLATILSRCKIVNLKTDHDSAGLDRIGDKFTEKITKLISQNTEERFTFVEKLNDKEEFLTALSVYFQQLMRGNNTGLLDQEQAHIFLKNLITAQRWNQANVNLRATLEYLMLKMPYLENQPENS